MSRAAAIGSFLLLTAAALLTAADLTTAGTIRVEKDGTGEFTVIQDAVDAAQPGDTILIGPGRYDDLREFTFTAGFGGPAVVGIKTSQLTIRGTDRDAVILGPADPVVGNGPLHHGFSVDSIAVGVVIEDLTVEHLWALVFSDTAVSIRNCRLREAGQGAVQFTHADGMLIESCVIEDNWAPSPAVFSPAGQSNSNLLIVACSFTENETPISLGSLDSATIRNCSFVGQVTAIDFWAGTTGTISGCTFTDTQNVHVASQISARMELADNLFDSGAGVTVYAGSSGIAFGRGNSFGGGSFATIQIQGTAASAEFHECDIENGGSWSVHAGTEVPEVDLRNNYWGSSSVDQIAGWIYDHEEWDLLGTVLFEPFSEDPLPAEAESIGGVKARFAPDR